MSIPVTQLAGLIAVSNQAIIVFMTLLVVLVAQARAWRRSRAASSGRCCCCLCSCRGSISRFSDSRRDLQLYRTLAADQPPRRRRQGLSVRALDDLRPLPRLAHLRPPGPDHHRRTLPRRHHDRHRPSAAEHTPAQGTTPPAPRPSPNPAPSRRSRPPNPDPAANPRISASSRRNPCSPVRLWPASCSSPWPASPAPRPCPPMCNPTRISSTPPSPASHSSWTSIPLRHHGKRKRRARSSCVCGPAREAPRRRSDLLAKGYILAYAAYLPDQDRDHAFSKFPQDLLAAKAAIRYLHGSATALHIDKERIGVWGAGPGARSPPSPPSPPTKRTSDGTLGDFPNESSAVRPCASSRASPIGAMPNSLATNTSTSPPPPPTSFSAATSRNSPAPPARPPPSITSAPPAPRPS